MTADFYTDSLPDLPGLDAPTCGCYGYRPLADDDPRVQSLPADERQYPIGEVTGFYRIFKQPPAPLQADRWYIGPLPVLPGQPHTHYAGTTAIYAWSDAWQSWYITPCVLTYDPRTRVATTLYGLQFQLGTPNARWVEARQDRADDPATWPWEMIEIKVPYLTLQDVGNAVQGTLH